MNKMRRGERHKVKKEQPETSSSTLQNEERDLAYYIHDRVELMHQVFSVLKTKELKALAPQCVQYISISDLQELCTEELLGISSKRLCAILDGAEPPSDTESSSPSPSPENLETISLDSISSDEEILSESSSKKKKHKHRRHGSKTKSKHRRRSSSEVSETNEDRSRASRAGLTVLELLELQARARAIRAQLQQEQVADAPVTATVSGVHGTSDDEVEIKEEPQEVVEISSEDEKPKIEELQKNLSVASKNSPATTNQVTKRINDLIITVPQTKPSRKIKLNRNKGPVAVTNNSGINSEANKSGTSQSATATTDKNIEKTSERSYIVSTSENTETTVVKPDTSKEKQKKKQKKKEKDKIKTKEGSDHDEITLQLSDTEKMDLLEDLDRKNYDKVSSSSTEDSESSSDSSEDEKENITQRSPVHKEVSKDVPNKVVDTNSDDNNQQNTDNVENKEDENTSIVTCNNHNNENKEVAPEDTTSCDTNIPAETELGNAAEKLPENQDNNTSIEITTAEYIPVCNDIETNVQDLSVNLERSTITNRDDTQDEVKMIKEPENNCDTILTVAEETTEVENDVKENTKELSEGEISGHESSEVEASELKPEVVCISDEEVDNKKTQKKKKKKEKKAKKEKKSKKTQDFHKGADENFYKDSNSKVENSGYLTKTINVDAEINTESCVDDVYEILELSSESSGNEEEGNSVLSKEPTAAEIEALSAKIDEIEREEVVTEEEIREHECLQAEKQAEGDVENVSWKDRYLESRKVKNVLSTANIFNALRKKNKELKRKLEESKKEKATVIQEVAEKTIETNLEEGSIEHYNTLEGSTKYVDPVVDEIEIKENASNVESEIKDGKVTKEMKKDAKQLLKMYKKLLKYNDITRQSDPNKKKKKKQKKNKDKKEKDKNESDAANNSLLVK